MLQRSSKFNENYACRVLRVETTEPIPGADRIHTATIGVDKVIISTSIHKGDLVLFFPVGTVISQKYLAANNLYSDPRLNSNYDAYMTVAEELNHLTNNPEEMTGPMERVGQLEITLRSMKGMFDYTGKVRIVKMRGVYSAGFVAPLETLTHIYPDLDFTEPAEGYGYAFDMVDGEELCHKFEVPSSQSIRQRTGKKYKHNKKTDRCPVPDTFRFHYNTANLESAGDVVDPMSNIIISVKLHGTSVILSNLPLKGRMTPWKKLLRFLGIPFSPVEYIHVYGSRRVVRGKYKSNPEYTDPVYGAADKVFSRFITNGMTVYGELVGYQEGTKKCFQSPSGVDHDYGLLPGQWALAPYRITETDPDGRIFEWDLPHVVEWAERVRSLLPDDQKYHMMPLTILYQGRAGDMYGLYEEISSKYTTKDMVEELAEWNASGSPSRVLPRYLTGIQEFIKHKWITAWIEHMREDKDLLGMELPEPLCRNKKAPREGVVIRSLDFPNQSALKLKSRAHWVLAQKAEDKGEVDMEG